MQGHWGLVAARLGRKKFRSEFRSAFWFDKVSGADTGAEDCAVLGTQKRLSRWAGNEVRHRSWKEAREAFRTTERRVDELIEERRLAEIRVADLPRLTE